MLKSSGRYNEALKNYNNYLKQREEEHEQEIKSIDSLYGIDLLKYIAKALCDIKYKIN